MDIKFLPKNAAVRIIPFTLFMVFIGIESMIHYCNTQGIITLSSQQLLYFYPLKTIVVGLTIVVLFKHYSEIIFADLCYWRDTTLSIIIGLFISFLWINMDWTLVDIVEPIGFDPTIIADGHIRTAIIATRLVGAVVVVPIMEELFWRSFLLRYIIDPQFSKVAIGRFTWLSFISTCVLFGLEHHYIIAGIMAGTLFNLLLYRTRSIAQCIISHAVANLALGIYVLNSAQWRFW